MKRLQENIFLTADSVNRNETLEISAADIGGLSDDLFGYNHHARGHVITHVITVAINSSASMGVPG